ncbi:MAG: Rieske (2Fe-2S) protein [Gammaproteobacteria bacterium]
MDNGFVSVANINEIESNKVYCFDVNGTAVVLCKVGDTFHAVQNQCTHANATFDKGRLRAHKLLCPLHGAIFDVRDGSVLGQPAFQPLHTFQVKVVADQIKVKV